MVNEFMLLVDDFQCSFASFVIDNEWNFTTGEIVEILSLKIGQSVIMGGGASGTYTVERLPDYYG